MLWTTVLVYLFVLFVNKDTTRIDMLSDYQGLWTVLSTFGEGPEGIRSFLRAPTMHLTLRVEKTQTKDMHYKI